MSFRICVDVLNIFDPSFLTFAAASCGSRGVIQSFEYELYCKRLYGYGHVESPICTLISIFEAFLRASLVLRHLQICQFQVALLEVHTAPETISRPPLISPGSTKIGSLRRIMNKNCG